MAVESCTEIWVQRLDPSGQVLGKPFISASPPDSPQPPRLEYKCGLATRTANAKPKGTHRKQQVKGYLGDPGRPTQRSLSHLENPSIVKVAGCDFKQCSKASEITLGWPLWSTESPFPGRTGAIPRASVYTEQYVFLFSELFTVGSCIAGWPPMTNSQKFVLWICRAERASTFWKCDQIILIKKNQHFHLIQPSVGALPRDI